jgi:RNA polymerase sigma-70 factor (ECF subfamily)
MGTIADGLLQGCKQGDLSAYEDLYSSHAGRMKSIAFHLLGNRSEAEDAVQETFLRIYRAVPNFDGPSGFDAWMYRILINCCYDAARKRRRQAEMELTADPAVPTSVPLRIALEKALARIHSAHRMVFWLFEVEGFRHSEIAGILEIPEGTSRKWLFEAKRDLKRLLTEVRS